MTNYKHLSEKDLTEGEDIINIVNSLDDESKKIILVYAGALRDRQMLNINR